MPVCVRGACTWYCLGPDELRAIVGQPSVRSASPSLYTTPLQAAPAANSGQIGAGSVPMSPKIGPAVGPSLAVVRSPLIGPSVAAKMPLQASVRNELVPKLVSREEQARRKEARERKEREQNSVEPGQGSPPSALRAAKDSDAEIRKTSAENKGMQAALAVVAGLERTKVCKYAAD